MARKRKTVLPRTDVYRKLDIVVIGVLWMTSVFEPWIYGWLDFTFGILFGEDYKDLGTFNTYKFLLLLCKCTLCMVLSVAVDLRNRKAMVCFIGLCLASLTPVLAVITVITKSEVYALASLSIYSVFFAVTPIRYVLIFNQKRHPSSLQVRKIVAGLEVIKSLSEFAFFLTKPDPKTFKIPALIVRWVIFIPMLVFLVTLLDVVRCKTAQDDPKERTFKSAAAGVLRDIKKSITDDPVSKRRKAIAVYQFSLFVVLLLPVITVLIANLILAKIEHKLNAHVVSGPGVNSNNVIDYTFYAYLANIIAIPLITVVINLFKNTVQTLADYLLLAFGHVSNSAVLIYLSIALAQKQLGDANQFGTDISSINTTTAEIERPGISVITVAGCNNDSIFIETPESNYTIDRISNNNIRITVILTAYETLYSWRVWTLLNNSARNVSTRVTPNKRYFYLIVTEKRSIRQIVEYSGAETLHRQVNPVMLVANGMTLEHSNQIPTFTLYPEDDPSDQTHLNLPPPQKILPVALPKTGKWTFSYNFTEEFTKKNKRPLIMSVSLRAYREILMALGDYDGGPHEIDVCIVAIPLKPFNLSDLIIKGETKKVLSPPVTALKGIAGAAISMGYLQFFWLESPLRFRTTLLSLVMVGEEITAYVITNVVSDVTNTAVISFTSIVCFLGAVHIIVGRIYETKLRRELWYAAPAVRSA